MEYKFKHASGKEYIINMTNEHVEKGYEVNKKPYEYYVLEHIERRLANKPGNIIDIGGHVGNHSVYLALFCADKVFAFEPNENNIKAYKANMKANKIKNYQLFPVGLGDIECKMGMRRRSANYDDLTYEMFGEGDYQVMRLDNYNLKDIKAIKIDVEGFDYRVMLGGTHTIKTWLPLILVEYAENVKRIDDFLVRLGYTKGHLFRQSTPIQEFIPPKR